MTCCALHYIALHFPQIQFSLLSRYPLTSGLTEVCDELGIRPIAYSPLALGLLTDKYTIDKYVHTHVNVFYLHCIWFHAVCHFNPNLHPNSFKPSSSQPIPPLLRSLVLTITTPCRLPKGPRSILFREFLPIMTPLLDTLRDIAKQRKKTVGQVCTTEKLFQFCFSQYYAP